jgi:hypothetical protein
MSTLAVAGTPILAAPCPPWCEKVKGHEYEPMDVDGSSAREQSTTTVRGPLPDDREMINAFAKQARNDASESVGEPLIDVVIEGDGRDVYIDGLTADPDARQGRVTSAGIVTPLEVAHVVGGPDPIVDRDQHLGSTRMMPAGAPSSAGIVRPGRFALPKAG